jgi:hypothetical protein
LEYSKLSKKIAQSVCRASYDIDDLLPFRMSEFFRSLFSRAESNFVRNAALAAEVRFLLRKALFQHPL